MGGNKRARLEPTDAWPLRAPSEIAREMVAGLMRGELSFVNDRVDVERSRKALPDAHSPITADANAGLWASSVALRLTNQGPLAEAELERLPPDLEVRAPPTVEMTRLRSCVVNITL